MKFLKAKDIKAIEAVGEKGVFIKELAKLDISISKGQTRFRVDHQKLILKPKAGFKPHYHKLTYDIFTVEKGAITAVVDEKKSTLSVGDSLAVEPNDIHSIYNHTGKMAILIETRLNVHNKDKHGSTDKN